MYIHTHTLIHISTPYIYGQYTIYKYIYMRRLAFPLATQKEMTWITLLPTEKWIKCINYFLYPMQTGIYSQYSAYDTQIT